MHQFVDVDHVIRVALKLPFAFVQFWFWLLNVKKKTSVTRNFKSWDFVRCLEISPLHFFPLKSSTYTVCGSHLVCWSLWKHTNAPVTSDNLWNPLQRTKWCLFPPYKQLCFLDSFLWKKMKQVTCLWSSCCRFDDNSCLWHLDRNI